MDSHTYAEEYDTQETITSQPNNLGWSSCAVTPFFARNQSATPFLLLPKKIGWFGRCAGQKEKDILQEGGEMLARTQLFMHIRISLLKCSNYIVKRREISLEYIFHEIFHTSFSLGQLFVYSSVRCFSRWMMWMWMRMGLVGSLVRWDSWRFLQAKAKFFLFFSELSVFCCGSVCVMWNVPQST